MAAGTWFGMMEKSEGTGGVECVCMQGEDDKLAKKAKWMACRMAHVLREGWLGVAASIWAEREMQL